MFWASLRVGITTLIDARTGAAVSLESEIGGWVEIDKCLTSSWRRELANREALLSQRLMGLGQFRGPGRLSIESVNPGIHQ